MKCNACSMFSRIISRGHRVVACVLVVGLLAACAASDKNRVVAIEAGTPEEDSEYNQADGMLLIFVREFSFDQNVDDISEEGRFVECVQNAVLETRPSQTVVSFDDFHETIFPKLNRRSVPHDPEYISILYDSPDFRRGMASLGIRYIVFVGGVIKVEPSGGGGCIGGYGGAACFGYWEWDKASHVGASVLDFQRTRVTESIETTATGTAWFAIIGVIPLGLPSKPSAVACRSLGEDIARYLARAKDNP